MKVQFFDSVFLISYEIITILLIISILFINIISRILYLIKSTFYYIFYNISYRY